MKIHFTAILYLSLFAGLVFAPSQANGEGMDSLKVDIGSMNYNYTYNLSGKKELTGSQSGMIVASLFNSVNSSLSTGMGLRLLRHSELNRTFHQSIFGAIRLYPLYPGTPIKSDNLNEKLVYYNILQPYVTMGGSVGRTLLRVVKGIENFEASSDFLSIFFGAGLGIQMYGDLFGEIGADYEMLFGMGSNELSGSHLLIRVGVSYFM